MFDVSPQEHMCVRNMLFSNCPSYIMDGHNILVTKASYNVVNESQMSVLLLVGIGYSRQLLDQWMSCCRSCGRSIQCTNVRYSMGLVLAPQNIDPLSWWDFLQSDSS